MKKLEVDTNMLQKHIDNMNDDIELIKKAVRDTYDGMVAMDAMWDGLANEAYNSQFLADHNRLLEICTALKKYADNTESARKLYDDTERAVFDIVSSMNV